MPTIPQKELRNNVGEVLRRAEAGEEFTITVAGRPVAELGPTRRRCWVSGPDLDQVWVSPGVTVAAARVLDAEGASDHLPLVVDLEVSSGV